MLESLSVFISLLHIIDYQTYKNMNHLENFVIKWHKCHIKLLCNSSLLDHLGYRDLLAITNKVRKVAQRNDTFHTSTSIVEILGPKLVAHIKFQKFLRNLKAHVCEPM
jgi:hypothetical protein